MNVSSFSKIFENSDDSEILFLEGMNLSFFTTSCAVFQIKIDYIDIFLINFYFSSTLNKIFPINAM